METKITRAELLSKRESLVTRLNELNSYKPVYLTNGRYLDGFGIISEMNDAKALALAYNYVESKSIEINGAVEELGLESLLDTAEEQTVSGYTPTDWIADIRSKAMEIINKNKINKISAAVTIIENNLSEEDRFSLEMSKVSELLDEEI